MLLMRPILLPSMAARLALALCLLPMVWLSELDDQRSARVPDIHFTPTRHLVADRMLQLANVTRDDVVYDLGSGDGRIPIIAAQKYGAHGVGIEIDPALVALARQNAIDAEVDDRVRFIEGDLYLTDIREATVVTAYLSPSIMKQLESKLRTELRPGARIVSHQFLMGGWAPDERVRIEESELFLWRVPMSVWHP